MGSLNIKTIIFLQIIFFAVALPCTAWEKVSFGHKTAKPPKFKIDCRKKQGKHDAFPTYTCYDNDGNSEAFDPGNDWVEVTVIMICFRHKVRDHIRGCIEIRGKQDNIESYGCVDAKGDLNIFMPDQSSWEELDAEDPDCRPHVVEMDIPRGTIDLEIDDSERRLKGETRK